MALANYTELQASLTAWLWNRTDLAAIIPDFIRLAEAQMDGEVRHRLMATTATLTLAGELTDLPADYRGMISVANSTRALPFVTLEQIADDKLTVTSLEGQGYSILGDQLQIWPAPANGDTVTIVYMTAIPSLADNSTNWLLTRWPNAYLFGSLIQAAPYLEDDDRATVWIAGYQAALTAIQKSDMAEKMRAPSVRSSMPTI